MDVNRRLDDSLRFFSTSCILRSGWETGGHELPAPASRWRADEHAAYASVLPGELCSTGATGFEIRLGMPKRDRSDSRTRFASSRRCTCCRRHGRRGSATYPVDVAATTLTELRQRRDEIIAVARARGASHVRVFGSVARGDATDASDVDFLVDLEPGRSLLDLGGLLMDLQDLLQRDVDVVTERGLRPRVADRVLADAVEL